MIKDADMSTQPFYDIVLVSTFKYFGTLLTNQAFIPNLLMFKGVIVIQITSLSEGSLA